MGIFLGDTAPSKIFIGDTAVSKVFVGDTQVRPAGWQPGANTVAYFPFKDDQLDHSGNGITLSSSGTKGDIGYQFSGSATFNNSSIVTVSAWYKIITISNTYNYVVLGYNRIGGIGYNAGHGQTALRNKIAIYRNTSFNIGASSDGMSYNAWHHLLYSYDGTQILLSKDGVVSTFYNGTFPSFNNDFLLAYKESGGTFNTEFSEVFVEDKARTQQEITDYYNQTKGNYGL